MPEPPPSARRARGPLTVIWLTLSVFLAVLAVLAVRVASGHDPGLLALQAKTTRPAKQVLVKRIYERVVVVHLPPNAPSQSSSSSQQVSTEAGGVSGAPVTRTS
ncbi:MAG TPA: hypothetical protein VIG42_07190 [Solirubrobacteraceae bacterium]|jgi:hypothetical protein